MGVLELRVHGVSGTPPHSMLGLGAGDEVRQVDGDGLTGFYRAKEPGLTSGPALPPGAVREAYSWGALTSSAGGPLGWLRRALWLTLLPFALVNVAMWARPGLSLPSARRTGAAVLVRTAALLLTALLVATACGVGIDLVAWQCFRGGVRSCPGLPGVADVLGTDLLDDPGRRLAVGQLLPLALLAVFAWLSRRTVARYESYPVPPGPPASAEPVLARPAMWDGERRAVTQRRLHLALGLAVVVSFTAWPMRQLAGGAGFAATGALAGAVAVLVVVIAGVGVRQQPEYSAAAPARDGSRWLLLAAVALVSVQTLLLLRPTAALDEQGDLYGVGGMPGGLVIALVAVTAALVGVARSAWSPALLAVPAGALALAGLTDAGSPARVAALTAALVLPAGAAMLWHRLAARRHVGWDAAAPAVLVGSAVLVAVLFSTGTTLLAADQLDGAPRFSAFAVQHDRQPTPPVLRLAAGSVLHRGLVEVSGERMVLRRGELRTATIDPVDGLPRETLTSRPLTGGELLLPGGLLRLRDSCVRVDGDTTTVSSSALAVPPGTRVSVDVAGAVPDGCGDLLSAPLRAVATDTTALLTVPTPYVWFAVVLPLLVVLVLAVLLGLHLQLRRSAYPAVDALAAAELGAAPPPVFRAARSARRRAAYSHRAEAVMSVVAVPAVLAALLVTVGVLWNRPPWDADEGASGGLRALVEVGRYLAVGLAVLLVLLGARLRASASLRRTVGILWDLATFWPRAAHPFGPPCYAERVVPELTARLTSALDRGDTVVLSGHSQGSTISVAVLMQLRSHPRFGAVHFVSYGTQLRTWFGRVFPDLLGPDVLGHAPAERPGFRSAWPDAPSVLGPAFQPPAGTLAAMLEVGAVTGGRWRSLFRRTDPIGFRAHQDTDGGPVDVPVGELGPAGTGLGTHSDYPATPEYAAVVGPWLG